MSADSDKAKANEIREKLTAMLAPVIEYLDELKNENFYVQWHIGPDPKTGKLELGSIQITKNVQL